MVSRTRRHTKFRLLPLLVLCSLCARSPRVDASEPSEPAPAKQGGSPGGRLGVVVGVVGIAVLTAVEATTVGLDIATAVALSNPGPIPNALPIATVVFGTVNILGATPVLLLANAQTEPPDDRVTVLLGTAVALGSISTGLGVSALVRAPGVIAEPGVSAAAGLLVATAYPTVVVDILLAERLAQLSNPRNVGLGVVGAVLGTGHVTAGIIYLASTPMASVTSTGMGLSIAGIVLGATTIGLSIATLVHTREIPIERQNPTAVPTNTTPSVVPTSVSVQPTITSQAPGEATVGLQIGGRF